MNNVFQSSHNPDVLSTFSNLSNDEVFTPPKVVNEMLDMLPQSLFKDKNTKFLDPASKSGVFLREIAKRLLEGLKEEIPILQERIDHILHNQLFGIAITELTSLLSRRTLYCSKYPNSKYSVSLFDNPDGNIKFKRVEHEWKNDKCSICGASKKNFFRSDNLENHAYEFIHKKTEEFEGMKFDVIIGNPPYQISDGGAQASAIPLYHKFVQQAIKLNPRYISMIIPSRWFSGGKGLDKFRYEMLRDERIRIIHDYWKASELFPNVEIKGGVNYFLWDRDNKGLCQVNTHQNGKITSKFERPLLEKNSDIFIRYNEAITIFRKVSSFKEASFSNIVSARKPFGLPTNFKDFKENKFSGSIKIFTYNKIGYIDKNKIKNGLDLINQWKLFTPYAIGSGEMKTDWLKPIVAKPNEICSETYLVIGPFESETQAKNAVSYIQTKFFHFLLGLRKTTQHATSKTYSFVPLQDFKSSWTDKILYEKYKLNEKEIDYIEKSINKNSNSDLKNE